MTSGNHSVKEANVRQNLGELGGWRHDKTFIGTGPGYEMLNALVLQHAVYHSDHQSAIDP